ncbi:MAG: Asp-tRNA(Asn)/Glu-tRNA(Gln) amidotransferase subunit GatC [Patescibacteria group bacterium]|nr:Asp-tRNA(Asn)/Glu-tRNA(Gln) amidotransferase subunit GatC [Patescibacteria group bacterium]
MSAIDKKTIKDLAELSRIKLTESEEKNLLSDLEKILDYFEELKEVNTDNVSPMTGGTFSRNIFRNDEDDNSLPKERAIEAFPEKKKGFLRVPPVFE